MLLLWPSRTYCRKYTLSSINFIHNNSKSAIVPVQPKLHVVAVVAMAVSEEVMEVFQELRHVTSVEVLTITLVIVRHKP
jgi:hypothetical protein